MRVIALVPIHGMPDPAAEFGGEPLVARAVDALFASGQVDEVLVQAEAQRNVAALGGPADLLVVHEPRRALTPTSVISTVIDMVRSGAAPAAVAAQPVTDTIKILESGDVLRGSWDRDRLREMQSPMCCRLELAMRRGRVPLPHELPHTQVQLAPGDPLGMRIDTHFDALVAETLLGQPERHSDNRYDRRTEES